MAGGGLPAHCLAARPGGTASQVTGWTPVAEVAIPVGTGCRDTHVADAVHAPLPAGAELRVNSPPK